MSDLDFPSQTDGRLHEREIGPARLRYPFARNPVADTTYREIVRRYLVDPARFTPRIPLRTTRTNNFLYSDDYSNAAWTKEFGSITAAAIANPIDGALTGQLFTASGTGGHGVSATANVSSSFLGNVFVVMVKLAGGLENIWLEFTDSAAGVDSCMFDLVAGSALPAGTGGSNRVGTLKLLGDGWFRLSMNFTAAGGAGTAKILGGTGGVVGIAASGPMFYLFGANIAPTAASGGYVPTTSATRSASVPDIDLWTNFNSQFADPFAYLVAESDLSDYNGKFCSIERTFARIPADQIEYGSKLINRPSLHGTKSGTAYAVGFSPGFDHIFTSARKAISSIGAITLGTVPVDAAAETLGTLPHDTFYMEDSVGSNLTQFCDTSIASLSAALITTFSTGISNWTVVGTPSNFTVKWTNGARSIKMVSSSSASIEITDNVQSGSFTVRALKPAVSADDTQRPNQNPSVRTINAPSHLGVVGDRVAFWQEDALVATSVVMSVPGSGSFTVPLKDVDGKDLTLTHCAFSSDADLCIANGPKVSSIRRPSKFYLPGASAGIATAADIPLQDPKLDPVNWLAAIVAGTAWVVIDDSDLSPHLGAMLRYTYSEVQLADAIVTVTP